MEEYLFQQVGVVCHGLSRYDTGVEFLGSRPLFWGLSHLRELFLQRHVPELRGSIIHPNAFLFDPALIPPVDAQPTRRGN